MKYKLIKEKDFQKVRQQIKENISSKIIFSSDNDDLNRKVLEKEEISILLINQKNRRDFQKQRNSGFNQVLAKIAKNKNISIGIDLDEIISSNKKEKPKIISRLIQNIVLCKKNRILMKFISMKHKRNLYDLKSFGFVLGMPTWMTKELEYIIL